MVPLVLPKSLCVVVIIYPRVCLKPDGLIPAPGTTTTCILRQSHCTQTRSLIIHSTLLSFPFPSFLSTRAHSQRFVKKSFLLFHSSMCNKLPNSLRTKIACKIFVQELSQQHYSKKKKKKKRLKRVNSDHM